MFLKYFSGTQKKAFLALAYKLAMADNVLTPEEKERLMDMIEEAGVDFNESMSKFEVRRLIKPFERLLERIYLLVELIGLEYVDKDFDFKENEIIMEICEEWKIRGELLMKLEDWVFRYNSLLNELNKIANTMEA